MNKDLTEELSAKKYWPAKAKEYLENKKYSKAVELCTIRLKDDPEILSGRIVLARALYHSQQLNEAESQFYQILQVDPDNILALKYLGDLKFRAGETEVAFSFYERVLKLDKYTRGLKSSLDKSQSDRTKETKLLTIKRAGETGESIEKTGERLKQLPFDTETAGDILMKQGHTRMAGKIFKKLFKKNETPQLLEKINILNKIITSQKTDQNKSE